jgi:DNA-binding NtrC family response regulator
LIVDDNEDLCQILQFLFEKKSISVRLVHTLQEAEAKLHYRPTIVFLDFNLPDGLGVQLIEKINLASKAAQIILISEQSSDSIFNIALNKGAYFLLNKPFSLKKINEILRKISISRRIDKPIDFT